MRCVQASRLTIQPVQTAQNLNQTLITHAQLLVGNHVPYFVQISEHFETLLKMSLNKYDESFSLGTEGLTGWLTRILRIRDKSFWVASSSPKSWRMRRVGAHRRYSFMIFNINGNEAVCRDEPTREWEQDAWSKPSCWKWGNGSQFLHLRPCTCLWIVFARCNIEISRDACMRIRIEHGGYWGGKSWLKKAHDEF